MTSSAYWVGAGYEGVTSDGKAWTTNRRYLGAGKWSYVVRFIKGQGEITSDHKRAAREAIKAERA